MIRPYDADRDAGDLWALKAAFERELGAATGDDGKAAAYEAKLDDAYRARYLDWVEGCVAREPRAVQVAEVADGGEADDGDGDVADGGENDDSPALAGYVFVLPAELAMIWDAAVLNEVFVRPAHRGTGVADDLLDAAVAVAADQELPLDRLVLDVDPDNGRARAFYDRHGFEPWGELVARPLP